MFHLELLLTAFDSLYRQKLRSTLTILGVAIGIATLVASVSVGVGVRRIIEDGFKREHRLREIMVYAGGGGGDDISDIPENEIKVEGNLNPERKKRIQKQLALLWRMKNSPNNRKFLTHDRIQELGKIEHVVRAEPVLTDSCQAIYNGRIALTTLAAQPHQEESIEHLLSAGRLPQQSGEAAIHEFLLYRLGLTSDEAMLGILDKTVRVEFRGTDRRQTDLLMQFFNADTSLMSTEEVTAIDRVRDLLPGTIKTLSLSETEKALLLKALSRPKKKLEPGKEIPTTGENLRIVGIFRSPEKSDNLPMVESWDSELALTHDHALQLFSNLPAYKTTGFSRAILTVDSEDHLKSVGEQLKAQGYQFYAVGIYLQIARKNTILIGFTMDFIALLALTVASLGITNTMFTAVLERTREIGILKAVGARDRHIMLTFLFEGVSIGIVGGLLGLLLGWLVSFPGDSYALKLIREQDPNMPQPTTVFRYPWWLLVGAPLFAVFVTTMAGLLPAKRAASIEPVEALRYE